MAKNFEARGASKPREIVIDDEGNLTVAFLMINSETFEMGFHWLPELFGRPIPQVLREEMVKRLRLHADMLESGELEQVMQQYVDINTGTPE